MKKILYAILVLLFISCKKEDKGPGALYVNNQFSATVIHLSDTTKINAIGWNAKIGCSNWGMGSYIDGTNINNEAVYLNISGPGNTFPASCISDPGTYYNFNCQYRPNTISQTSPIYENSGVYDPGSITFTKMNGNYAEGYFYAFCKYNTDDSVFIKGTFKGFLDQ